jgi:HPt (histidine-containing phosphotransfer) domain-containing protein
LDRANKVKIPDDPFIRELLPEFVDTWINDIDTQYGKYIADKDSAELYRLAHTLKGSCFQFGLDEIANMGIELMGYAKSEDWDKAAAMEEQLRRIFAEVKVFVEENLSEMQ